MVTGDLSLFGDDDEPDEPLSPAVAGAAEWQVSLIRKALDVRGLATSSERREAVQRVVERAVPALRDLTSEEAVRVLSKLGASSNGARSSSASAWDGRDEDTWIDRL